MVGMSEKPELDDLAQDRRLGFYDYEACLEEFEGAIKGEKAFLKEAARVTSPVAYELSLQNGVPEKKLRAIWNKP